MKPNSIETVQRYFSLSNARDLTTIETMIHPEATYSSVNTGLYFGQPDIMQMMHSFFRSFQSIHWYIDEIKAKSMHITEVHFTCESQDMDGISLKRQGIETIVVLDGLIRHIDVR